MSEVSDQIKMAAYIVTIFIPGAGHIILGHTKRGIAILSGLLLSSFVLGLTIGIVLLFLWPILFVIQVIAVIIAIVDLKRILNKKPDDEKYTYNPKYLRK